MPKTPASAGGIRKGEAIEMSAIGNPGAAGPSQAGPRRLEKSVSVPMQRLKTPTTEQRNVFELGEPPNRNIFQRGNTIREAVGDFVGLSETPVEASEEMKSWSNRRLQYFNRKFKLSKDFVHACGQDQPPPTSLHSLSPVAMQPPSTPGLASFHVVEPLPDPRNRSLSIESRRPRRESAFKIIKENCASLVTRGRLTPTAAAPTRLRRNNGTASFTVSESPLPSSSLTPAPTPLQPMPSVPSRDAPSTEKDARGGRKRELHRLLEDEEYVTMVEAADGPAAADAARAAARAAEKAAAAPAAPAAAAAHPARQAAGSLGAADSSAITASFYPASIQSFISPELIRPPHSGRGAGDLPAAAAAAASFASGSPPFQLSRPTMLPMGDETTAQSIVHEELFFDITPPRRPSRPHFALPGPEPEAPPGIIGLGGFARGGAGRGPIPLGGRVTPVAKSLLPDRAPPPAPALPKKVKFVDKPLLLVEHLAKQLEARSREQTKYRTGGVGAFGECVGRKTKMFEQLPENLKRRLKSTVNERPFFTYWVTFTQILVCIASICIFGFGAFSPSFAKKEGEVLSLDQTLITVGVYEKGNIWLGPKFADLIRLGAKYSPCMRAERKIMNLIEQDRVSESYTGCCVHTDGTCYQAGEQCPRSLATLYLHRPTLLNGRGSSSKARKGGGSQGLRKTQSAPDLQQLSTARRSEVVCGLDPDVCESPSPSNFPLEDITKWPLCEKELDATMTGYRPRHLTCKVHGRPCCIHLQGRCRITTVQYCEFVGGIFHEDASLCSQVNCLHGICGMIPFGESPNQLYRLFTSLFLHAGLGHLAITIFFQMVFMRDLESYIGWKRMALIYFISGIGGNLASAIFVPFNPEVGPSGALAGIVTTLFVDVFASRELLEQPALALAQNGGWLLALFVVGLLPWVDNWAILFGSLFGLLAAFVYFPDVGLTRGKVFRRAIVIFGLISQCALGALLLYVFVENVDIDCTWCGYFNCFNWYKFLANDPDDGNHFCDNQGLTVNSWLPI